MQIFLKILYAYAICQTLWCTNFKDINWYIVWQIKGNMKQFCNEIVLNFQGGHVENDHEIFSMVILSLPLIQEGQLSVSGEKMCTTLIIT